MITAVVIVLGVLLTGGVLYLLHYGYKLAFYYQDPQAGPYDYKPKEHILSHRECLDGAIAEFLDQPFQEVQIRAHDGLTLCGRYYHVAEGGPLEIQCHGYKGNAIRDFCGLSRIARSQGRNVLLIDQRCHGKSEGHTITFGIRERQDCCAWIQWALERFGDIPIVLSGVSMGAATVLMAAGMDLPRNVKAVIADCPYDAPCNIIQKVLETDMGMNPKLVYPLIRLGGMVWGGFDLEKDSPLAAVKRTKLPILLLHGDRDLFVPHAMSCNIKASAPEKIHFHTIPGAGHAMNYVTAPEGYTAIVTEFLNKYL